MPRCPTCYRRLVDGACCPRHATALIPGRETSIPAVPELPGYRAHTYLGSGGFATVWAAVRDDDSAEVAIKVSHAATSKARRRFAAEAEALRRVGPPHVPAFHELGMLDNGQPYLVMERLLGTPLARELGELPESPDLAWVQDVGDAVLASLEAVHAMGLVHGDLKPDNIFLVSAQMVQARLLDLGGAKARSGDGNDPGHVSGKDSAPSDDDTQDEVVASAEYMAPEQLAGRIDQRADVYSMGVLIYELLTLRVPFVGDVASMRHGHRALRPPWPSSFASVPGPVEALCLTCLAKEPDKRPRHATELRQLLAQAVAASHAGGTLTTSAQRSRSSSSTLGSERQPVVLLAAEVPSARRAVEYVIERHRGVVARQRGARYICGFSAFDDEEPVQAAMATARELVEQFGARVVLHMATLKVRRRRRGQPARLYGSALEAIDTWMPRGEWQGILLTGKLASALPDGRARLADAHPEFFELIEDQAASTDSTLTPPMGVSMGVPMSEPAFVGREHLLGQAMESLRDVLDHAHPGLFTAHGESGVGKSRLTRQMVKLVTRTSPDIAVMYVRATRRTLEQPDETLRALIALMAERTGIELSTQYGNNLSEGARLLGEGLRQAALARPIALIIDDIHYADGATLDAIEYATLDGEDIRLWIFVSAHPQLWRRRPQWSERAHQHVSVEIEPLSAEDSMKLAAELLRPAEYPPRATLERLVHWSGGNPHSLEELVRTLKREGIVRKRARSDSWYVATAELDRLPVSPAEQWLAARQLDALPAELAACLRLCAVLGIEFLRDELEWVQSAAERSGLAWSSIDTDIGLRELERLGFILGQHGAWLFRHAAFQDAVYKLVGARERKRVHDAALSFWRGRAGEGASDRVLGAIARHAGASEVEGEAADAALALGDRACRRNHAVDADQHYTAALAFIAEDDHVRRMRALGGRGKMCYRVQRTREAIEDLRAAQDHAVALGDDEALADLLLEEATALDFEWRFQESADRVDKARPLVEACKSHRLEARYWNGVARCYHRQDRIPEALELFERAMDLALACGDHETQIVALLLMASGLTYVNRLDEARARFDEVIALCESAGDRIHLCAAYSNRGLLWLQLNSLHQGIQDLRRAMRLAREVGQPIAERIAAHNLAELLYRGGRFTEALSLARRAYALQRVLPEPVPPDALLLARIHAALDELDEVRALVAEVRTLAARQALTQLERIALAMLELTLDEAAGQRGADEWQALMHEARACLPNDEILEILYVRACSAVRVAKWQEARAALDEAGALLDEHPGWHNLFDSLAIDGQ